MCDYIAQTKKITNYINKATFAVINTVGNISAFVKIVKIAIGSVK